MQKWDERLWLLTQKEFNELADGVKLESINGDIYTKGLDYIDLDVRFGCLAFGLTQELVREQDLDHDFLAMLLKS